MENLGNLWQELETLKARVEGLMKAVGWDEREVLAEARRSEEFLRCPIDSRGHIVLPINLPRHVRACRLRQRGLDPSRVVVLPSSLFTYSHSPLIVSLVEGERNEEDNLSKEVDRKDKRPTEEKKEEGGRKRRTGLLQRLEDIEDLQVEEPGEVGEKGGGEGGGLEGQIGLLWAPDSDKHPSNQNVSDPPIQSWVTTGIPRNMGVISQDGSIDKGRLMAWLVGWTEKYLPPSSGALFQQADDISFLANVILQALPIGPQSLVPHLYPFFQSRTALFIRAVWRHLWSQLHSIPDSGIPPEQPLSHLEDQQAKIGAALVRASQSASGGTTGGVPSSNGGTEAAMAYDALVAKARELRERAVNLLETSPGGVSLSQLVADAKAVFEKEEARRRAEAMRPKTELELLALQRDTRRRRQTYRAKNTHITKRTPVQVQRDTISLWMAELYPHLIVHPPAPTTKEEEPVEDEGDQGSRRDRRRDRDRHADRDRDRYRDKDRDSVERDRERDRGRDKRRDSEERDRDRDRGREKRRDEERDRDRDRRRDRDDRRDRDRDRERDRDEGRDWDIDKEDRREHRDRDRDRDRDRHRDRYRHREKERDRKERKDEGKKAEEEG